MNINYIDYFMFFSKDFFYIINIKMKKTSKMKYGGYPIPLSTTLDLKVSTSGWLSNFITKVMSSNVVSYSKSSYTSAVEKLFSISIPGYSQISQIAKEYVLNPTIENLSQLNTLLSRNKLAIGGVVAASISAIAYYKYNKYSQNKELAKKTIDEIYCSSPKDVVNSELQEKLPQIVPQDLIVLSQVDQPRYRKKKTRKSSTKRVKRTKSRSRGKKSNKNKRASKRH